MNTNIATALITILTAHVNTHGRVVDAVICRSIAEYMTNIPFGVYYADTLYAFIIEYGESEDLAYDGYDEDGDRAYMSLNPSTNWNVRINKELSALGHYERYAEWTEKQKMDVAAV